MSKRIIIVASFIVLSVFQTFAQVGREFWFVAPEVNSVHGDSPAAFRITAQDDAAQVVISVPADPGLDPIVLNVPANTQAVQEVYNWYHQINRRWEHIENKPIGRVNNKGIRIESSHDITVYYEVSNSSNPDKFTLKGQNALGKEFLVPSQNKHKNTGWVSAYEHVDIVATKNQTEVWITPSVSVVGHTAGQAFRVDLQQGQTFGIQNMNKDAASSFGGTIISANKDIAVTISDDSVQETKSGSSACDLIGDQLIPVSMIGCEYIAMRTNTGGGGHPIEEVYVMAVEDGTQVYWGEGVKLPSTLNRGETKRFHIVDNAIYIKSDKPVYAYQVSSFDDSTNGNEMGSAVLPQISCTGSKKVVFQRIFNFNFYIQLLTKGKNRSSFTLDGAPFVIKDSDWELVEGTLVNGNTDDAWYSMAKNFKHLATTNTYEIANTVGFFHMSILDQNDLSVSYGYFSSYGSLSIEGMTKACQGKIVTLSTIEPMLSYSWYKDSPTDVLSTERECQINSSGTYYITSRSELGCVMTASIDVDFTWPEFDLPDEIEVCPGEVVELALPTGLGTYEWSDNTNQHITSVTLKPNTAKTVSVTVTATDDLQCSHTEEATISSKATPVVDLNDKYTVCKGATITSSTTCSWYEWTINGVAKGSVTGINLQPEIVANIQGTYKLDLGWDDTGCSLEATTVVTVQDLPEIPLGDQVICNGETHQYRFNDPGNIYTYHWDYSSALPDSYLSDSEFMGHGSVVLKVTNRTTACQSSKVLVVRERPELVLDLQASKPLYCEGKNILLTATAGYETYNWQFTPEGGTSVNLGTTNSNTYEIPNITVNQKGTYTLVVEVVENNLGCTKSTTLDVDVVVNPEVLIEEDYRDICLGEEIQCAIECDSYQWYFNGGELDGENRRSITVNQSGLYKVEGTNENGCSSSYELEVTVHNQPNFTLTDPTVCQGETHTFEGPDAPAGNSYRYSWQYGADAPVTTQNYTMTSYGTPVNLTVTDKYECSHTVPVTLQMQKKPELTLSTKLNLCENDDLIIEASNAFTSYEWFKVAPGGDIPLGTPAVNPHIYVQDNVQPANGGIYKLTVTEGVCEVSQEMTIDVFDTPDLTITDVPEVCAGETVLLEANGDFDLFKWVDNNDAFLSNRAGHTLETVGTDQAGTYKVTATKGNCTVGKSVTLQVNPLPVFTLNDEGLSPQCVGVKVNTEILTNSYQGAPVANYAWTIENHDGGAVANYNTASISLTQSADISLTVTDDKGCVTTESTTYENHKSILFDVKAEADKVCPGSGIEITANDGFYDYEWFLKKPGETNKTPLNVSTKMYEVTNANKTDHEGTYIVTAKGDGNHCPVSDEFELTVKEIEELNVDVPEDFCKNDIVEVIIADPDFLTFSWYKGGTATGTSFGSGPKQVISEGGSYTVKAEYKNGCYKVNTIDVDQLELPTVTLNPADKVCPGPNQSFDLPVIKTFTTTPENGGFASFQWFDAAGNTVGPKSSIIG
ncbi:MAG: IgGFc-binding protein, partial [Marinilabiliaceae bacterium]|nr:IgGFc-binding protein [Marinilabiliaceae bacterium]